MDSFVALQRLSRITQTSDVASALQGFTIESPTQTTQGDGSRKIATAIVNPTVDLTIPIGTWKLRLVPQSAASGLRIPISLIVESNNAFREIRVELARFELEADPQHLIAADLHTEPHTYLTRTSGNPPVRLLGPGVLLILRGASLEPDLEVTGATGGTDAAFPSARFEPPHFIMGGTNDKLGVVCDEVLVDLKRSANPTIVNTKLPGVGPSWTGLHLKQLGVFIGDGTEVGTWSGMAAMKDFFIGFDAVDLSGTFMAELVHYVVDTPQVQITISYRDASGNEVTATASGDANIPAPPSNREFALVRLRAQPSWDSAGFRASWDVPPSVAVDEPRRTSELDLGWVRVPPGGPYAFTCHIRDHRVPPQDPTRNVIVAQPAVGGGPAQLSVVVDGVLEDGFPAGERSTNRLHMTMRPGQRAVVSARVGGGSGNPVNATLTPGALSLVTGAASQTATRPAGSSVYGVLTWTVQAPATVPATPHSTVVLAVVDGSTTVNRRLRMTIAEGPPTGHRDFELASYTDWRPDPGIGLARIDLRNGLQMADISWTLDSEPVTDTIFSAATLDTLFDGTAYASSETVQLSDSGGTVRPFLHTAARLWRLRGSVAANPTAAGPRAPVVVGEPALSALHHEVIRTFVGTSPPPIDHPSNGSGPAPIAFRYNCDQVLPVSGCTQSGPETSPPSSATVDAAQAGGFLALFRAIEHYGTQIDSIGLFGGASVEGPDDHNLNLSERRARNARDALVSPSSALQAAMSTAAGGAGYTMPSSVASLLSTLNTTGKLTAAGFGERAAHSPIRWEDRRVFAVLLLKPGTATQAVAHEEYFVTLPGAPPPAEHPRTPTPRLQEHPFRHSVFRLAHVEVELLRNRLVRLQIRLKLDLEKFNENEVEPGRQLNDLDGVTTFFLEMKQNPNPGVGEPEFSWELVVLADPGDVDGLKAINTPPDPVGGPTVTVPALTALSGGRTGLSGLAVGVSVGAILGALGIVDVQTIVWRGVRLKLRHGNVARPSLSAAVDYTVRYAIDADLGEMIGLPANAFRFRTDPGHPIEVSFRNVGMDVLDMQTVEFFYNPADGFQLDINDPGVFRLGEGLGRLLQVNRVRSGAGSPLWLEIELSLSIDTGIFSVDRLRIRVSLEMDKLFETDSSGQIKLGSENISVQDFDISVNKLGVSVNVPGALKGRGELGVHGEAGGTVVEGDLDLSLVPLDLRVYGGLKIFSASPPDTLRALYAYLGVEFAPGIPIGTTGAAIYGFSGLVGVNMGRSTPQPLPWFKGPPVGVYQTSKWVPARGNWAFGVGTVVGTAYDNGFTFNMKGSFILEIPGPKFLLATEAKFVAVKPEVSSAATGQILCVVMLDFENDLLLIGIDFVYDEPNFLTFRVPTEVFFNLADASDWHIRFGQWDPAEKRMTVTILGIYSAWGYLQIEGNGFQIPGVLDLHGICLAHGARFEIFWGSRDVGIYLECFLEYHVGVQLEPLMIQGQLDVGGELHLGPVSIGAHGKLVIMAPDPLVIHGEVCGEVDLWLFSIEGCVGVTIGDGSAPLPDPDSPFKQMVVIDRMTSAAVENPNAASLDSVVHMVFNQDMIDGRPTPGTNVADLGRSRNQVSGDLFYEYTLVTGQVVRKSNGAPVTPQKSAWAPYSLPDASAQDADSARTLRMLDWIPHAHSRALDFTRGYEKTLEELIKRLCDPVPPPDVDCATFDEEPLGSNSFWALTESELSPVWVVSSQPDGLGAEFMGNLIHYSLARVVPLVPVAYPNRTPVTHCLRLPNSARQGRYSLAQLFGATTLQTRVAGNGERRNGDGTVASARPIVDVGERLVDAVRDRVNEVRSAAVATRTPAAEIGDVDLRLVDAASEHLVRGDSKTPLLDLSPRSATGLTASHATHQTTILLTGLVFISVPDLVAVDVTFVVPEKLSADGEVVFLDASFQPLTAAISIQAAPVVPGSVGTGDFAQHVARRIRFSGPTETSTEEPDRVAWLLIRPPGFVHQQGTDPSSYLNEICGVGYGEWKRWRDRVGDRERAILELTELTGVVGGTPAVSTGELLEPNTEYEVRATYTWARFRDGSTTSNDGAVSGPQALSSSALSFKTSAIPPADIRRYVLDHNPPDDEQPHYYGERVGIRFASDVIDRLFAKYGKQLVARAKADTGKHVLNQPLSAGAARQFFPLDGFETVLYDVLQSLSGSCLPGDWSRLFPKTVYDFPQDLTPNTGYTVTLIPRPLGEPGAGTTESQWDDLLQADFDAGRHVFRFDLHTSRWGSFADHVQAYRDAPVGDVFADDEAALNAALAAIATGRERTDESVDALSTALFGGPIVIPPAPKVLRVWVPTGPPPSPYDPPPYRCRAILLDGPETLLKRRADATARTRIEARATTNAWDAFSSGLALAGLRVITGARGARVFLLFSPASAPAHVKVELANRPVATDPEEIEHLTIPVGSQPGSLTEEAT